MSTSYCEIEFWAVETLQHGRKPGLTVEFYTFTCNFRVFEMTTLGENLSYDRLTG